MEPPEARSEVTVEVATVAVTLSVADEGVPLEGGCGGGGLSMFILAKRVECGCRSCTQTEVGLSDNLVWP